MGATSGRLSSGTATAGGWFTKVVFFMARHDSRSMRFRKRIREIRSFDELGCSTNWVFRRIRSSDESDLSTNCVLRRKIAVQFRIDHGGRVEQRVGVLRGKSQIAITRIQHE